MVESVKISKRKTFLMPIMISVIFGAVLFIPAGSFHFWQAWILWSGFFVITLLITFYFSKRSPDFLARRMQYKEKKATKRPPAFLNLFFLCYVIPGFDYRFHWSTVPVWAVIAANAIVLLGYIFIFVVFKENIYASTIIQVEKEQRVITTGPYAVVRHPMYLGLLVMVLFSPVALGSYWAIIPALLCIPMNILRIKSEESVLLENLAGYNDYCTKTPYRLIPFIW